MIFHGALAGTGFALGLTVIGAAPLAACVPFLIVVLAHWAVWFGMDWLRDHLLNGASYEK